MKCIIVENAASDVNGDAQPKSHMKLLTSIYRQGGRLVRFVITLAFCLLLGALCPAQAATWSILDDPEGRFSIELPAESFMPSSSSSEPGHFTFAETGGGAVLDLYSGRNVQGLAPGDFIRALSKSPRIADVTYSATAPTWCAISGHYVREGTEEGDLIYYAKFVFTADLSAFAAFEISYPVGEKLRMDPVVIHLEKTLRLAH